MLFLYKSEEISCVISRMMTQIGVMFKLMKIIRNEWAGLEKESRSYDSDRDDSACKAFNAQVTQQLPPVFADSTPRVMERQMIPGAVWKTTACLLRDSPRRASRGETLSASLYYASLVFQRAHVTRASSAAIAPAVMNTRSASGKEARWNWLIYAPRDEEWTAARGL